MTIEARVIAHSVAEGSPPLATLQLRYPRMIHSEFMTHRAFSRNASSSRAVPVARMIEDVANDMAEPVEWGANRPGMQAGEPLRGHELAEARWAWRQAGRYALMQARMLAEAGVHKQIVNRVLEPFAHISVVVTATEWDNFFALRCHPDADPTMRALAEAMREALEASTPHEIGPCDWHLPYVTIKERHQGNINDLLRYSAARCARVSYLRHDGATPSHQDDLALFARLNGEVLHASPMEHQANPTANHRRHEKNLRGWMQFRAVVEHDRARVAL